MWTQPPSAERNMWEQALKIQIGYNINKSTAIYVDGLVGIGHNRPYDGGVGLGLRFKY
jgi:hypothetical protein